MGLTFYTPVFAQYQELLGKTGKPCHDKYLKLNVKKTLCYNGHNKKNGAPIKHSNKKSNKKHTF